MNTAHAARPGIFIFWLKIGLTVAGMVLAGLAAAQTWRFAVIGDVPYSDYERAELPRMLESIAARHVEFVAHVGDFKHGKDRCDDAVFLDRQTIFNASRVPFIFVPGDNEWTDCDRLSNGAYDPLERLNKLRSLFWHENLSLGQTQLKLERQPGSYPEHARFRIGPVLFVTLNVPGSNNNRGMATQASTEFLNRMPVVLHWLKESFDLARRDSLKGVVVLFQADPDFKHFAQGFPHNGYKAFLETLRDETSNFSGQVIAIHGDTHTSRIDQPLRDSAGKTIANFRRVETFGYPVMGWTQGVISLDDAALFRFETHPWPEKSP